MLKHITMPVDAVVAVTYRCNSRCIMCNIWQIKNFPEVPAEYYKRLPASLKDVNISGGEPFLRSDLPQVVRIIRKACPKAKITISTNGFLVDVIKRVLPQIKKIDPDIGISISIDGVGIMHEKVRRVPNAWNKVIETMHFCRDVMKIQSVGFAFTLNNLNYKQLKDAYEWSHKLGAHFTMAVAHSSSFYFSKDNKLRFSKKEMQRQFKHVIKDLLDSVNPKDWVRAFFVDGLFKVAQGKKRPLESFPGQDFFYMDPKGDVYPSVVDNVIMGNLADYKSFEALWYSSKAEEARDAVKGFENNYWMVCTARTGIKRNPLKVANWIFRTKLGGGDW